RQQTVAEVVFTLLEFRRLLFRSSLHSGKARARWERASRRSRPKRWKASRPPHFPSRRASEKGIRPRSQKSASTAYARKKRRMRLGQGTLMGSEDGKPRPSPTGPWPGG